MSVRNIFKKTVLSLSVAGAMAGGQAAMAYEAGDIIVRAGAALVEPNESSGTIYIDTLNAPATGAEVGVDPEVQFGITGTYMVNSKIGVELLAATPFSHDIAGAAGAAGFDKLAETKHLPPTLTLNYFFNDPASDFQPYIGAGINYTVFFDEEVTPALDSDTAIGTLAFLANNAIAVSDVTNVNGTNIDLEDSVGLALHMGFDYAITEDLGLNLAYWNINIDTTAEINTTADIAGVGTGVGIKAHVDVDIDPHVYMAGIYYKF